MLTLRLYGGSQVTSWPWSSIRPDVGSSKPPIIRRVVVLPQPDGPRRLKNSPSRTSRSMWSTATRLAESLDHIDEPDVDGGHGRSALLRSVGGVPRRDGGPRALLTSRRTADPSTRSVRRGYGVSRGVSRKRDLVARWPLRARFARRISATHHLRVARSEGGHRSPRPERRPVAVAGCPQPRGVGFRHFPCQNEVRTRPHDHDHRRRRP